MGHVMRKAFFVTATVLIVQIVDVAVHFSDPEHRTLVIQIDANRILVDRET